MNSVVGSSLCVREQRSRRKGEGCKMQEDTTLQQRLGCDQTGARRNSVCRCAPPFFPPRLRPSCLDRQQMIFQLNSHPRTSSIVAQG